MVFSYLKQLQIVTFIAIYFLGATAVFSQSEICCPKIIGGASDIIAFHPGAHVSFTVVLANTDTCTWHLGQMILNSPDTGAFTFQPPITSILGKSSAQIFFLFNPTDSLHHYTAELLLLSAAPCTDTLVITWDFANSVSSRATTAPSNGFALDQNYPNPFSTLTTVHYTTPTETAVAISVHDITGRLIKNISSGTVSSGEHLLTIGVDDLPNGIYFLMLESNNIRLSRQIVVSR